jgi:hypothetical protein
MLHSIPVELEYDGDSDMLDEEQDNDIMHDVEREEV